MTAIAYVDGLIQSVLDTLDELQLADDTVVSFTGDHGWSTGEHNVWYTYAWHDVINHMTPQLYRCKMTNSEAGTRVPLFFRAPWIKSAVGAKTKALAELVDLFPVCRV